MTLPDGREVCLHCGAPVEPGAVVCASLACVGADDEEALRRRIQADECALLGITTPPDWSVTFRVEPGDVERAARRVMNGIIVTDDPSPEMAARSEPCCPLHSDD